MESATQSKNKKKNRYQPKTTGAIKWGDKRDKKRDVKNGNKDNYNYEKTIYTHDSPKFVEYYKVWKLSLLKECLDLVCRYSYRERVCYVWSDLEGKVTGHIPT